MSLLAQKRRLDGFTLPELLIVLLILGEIATFTIPKILAGQATARNNAIAKEAMATFANAYQQLQFNSSGGVSTATTPGALSQYMNYVKVDTTSTIDTYPGIAVGTFSCATYNCLQLHNGALLMLDSPSFAASGGTNGIVDVVLDPDGTVTSKGDSLVLVLRYNGRSQTFGDYANNTAYTPSWFSY